MCIFIFPGDIDGTDPDKPPRYIGLAIGLGVCAALLLLSGAAVFLLNIRRGDALFRMRTLAMNRKKEDEEAFSRLPGQTRRPTKLSIIPIDRIVRQNSAAANQGNNA